MPGSIPVVDPVPSLDGHLGAHRGPIARTPLGTLHRRLIIEMRVDHRVEIERNAVQHPHIDDCARTRRGVGECRDEYAAFGANEKLGRPVRKAIATHLGFVRDVKRNFASRIRGADNPVTPAERATIVPQRPMRRIDFGSVNDFKGAAMAAASILGHVILELNRFIEWSGIISPRRRDALFCPKVRIYGI